VKKKKERRVWTYYEIQRRDLRTLEGRREGRAHFMTGLLRKDGGGIMAMYGSTDVTECGKLVTSLYSGIVQVLARDFAPGLQCKSQ
jgi:hypothetical protein